MRTLTKRLIDATARGDTETAARVQGFIDARAARNRVDMDRAFSAQTERERIAAADRAAAPFGRCAFTGDPLTDPGDLSYAQAEKLFGWAPCQVRYGRWPNRARAI